LQYTYFICYQSLGLLLDRLPSHHFAMWSVPNAICKGYQVKIFLRLSRTIKSVNSLAKTGPIKKCQFLWRMWIHTS